MKLWAVFAVALASLSIPQLAEAEERLLLRVNPAPDCGRAIACWAELEAKLDGAGIWHAAPLLPWRVQGAMRSAPSGLERTLVVRYSSYEGTAFKAFVDELNELKSVELSEVDAIGWGAGSWIPEDERWPEQWSLEQPEDVDVDASAAWGLSRGSAQVIIAILDSGIDYNHHEFQGRVLEGWDFVNDDADPWDDAGHGTNVSSIAAAAGDGIGVVGICPHCSLLPVKVLSSENWGYYSWWAAGIQWAVEHDADIINLSLGGTEGSVVLADAVSSAHDSGVVVVAAMMNDNAEKSYIPARLEESIAVGATDRTDRRAAPFSWGGGSNWGSHIDVVAPGNDILGAAAGGGYGVWSGTSQATPLVAGSLALLLSKDPELSPAELRAMLQQGVVDQVGREEEDLPGFDPFHGWGRLNAFLLLSNSGLFDDLDGDGYPQPLDCDDGDEARYPGAQDPAWDGVDSDCDAQTGEGSVALALNALTLPRSFLPRQATQSGVSDCSCSMNTPQKAIPVWLSLFQLLWIPLLLHGRKS